MDDMPPRLWFAITLILTVLWIGCRIRVGILKRRYAGGGRLRQIGNNLELGYALRGLIVACVLAAVGMVRFDLSFFWAWIAAINIATVAFYGWDKLAAVLAVFRVPESTLHVMSAVGGSVGGLVGQDLFNHKVRDAKRGFRFVQWTIIGFHIAMVAVYVRTRSGQT